MSESTSSATTPERDPKTGLYPHIEYKRKPDGKIDWRAMINPAHIVFNTTKPNLCAEIEKAYGGPATSLVYAEVVAKQPVQDKHILVLLAGFKELAELRGYIRSVPTILNGDQSAAYCAWEIDWIENSEEPEGKTSGGTADATMENTNGWGYLGAMAGNRAFVRAVKNGLGINLLGFDEIAKKDTALPEAAPSSSAVVTATVSGVGQPVPTLIRVCGEHKISFEAVKKSATKKHLEQDKWSKDVNGSPVPPFKSDPTLWSAFEDIHPIDCMTLITAIKEHAKKVAEKAKK